MTHQIIVLDSSLETYLYDSVLRLIIIFYIYIYIYIQISLTKELTIGQKRQKYSVNAGCGFCSSRTPAVRYWSIVSVHIQGQTKSLCRRPETEG